jgi:hypothetical protein
MVHFFKIFVKRDAVFQNIKTKKIKEETNNILIIIINKLQTKVN